MSWPSERELLHAVVELLDHVDVAGRVGDHAAGLVELARPVPRRAVAAVAPPLAQELAVGGERLDPVVAVVGDVDGAVGPDADAARVVELAVAHALGPPRAHQRAEQVELHHAVVAVVDHVDRTAVVHGHAVGRLQAQPVLPVRR